MSIQALQWHRDRDDQNDQTENARKHWCFRFAAAANKPKPKTARIGGRDPSPVLSANKRLAHLLERVKQFMSNARATMKATD